MRMKKVSSEHVHEVLARGTSQIVDRAQLEKLLTGGKKLRVKLGIDPTAPDLHLGHSVILRKLRQFQDLGHRVVLIIGDFTAQIGDPSGKSKTRQALTEAQVKKNMKTYLAQARKILDMRRAEVKKNSAWLQKLNGAKLVDLMSKVSVQQLIERDDFSKRLAAHQSIRTHELLYPILQAYDSVMVRADVEIGGNDQLFNLLIGRALMERFSLPPQQIMTTQLLVGLDGTQKMSKSLDNYIGIAEVPNEMFGKLMSIPDRLMRPYFELCTDLPYLEIEKILRAGNPRDAKLRLAHEIVRMYHGAKAAAQAEERWKKVFSRKQVADDIPELRLVGGHLAAVDVPVVAHVAKSKSEAWRLVEQGGFKVNDKPVTDPRAMVSLKTGDVLKMGKKTFFRVKI